MAMRILPKIIRAIEKNKMAKLDGALIRRVFLFLLLSGTLNADLDCSRRTCDFLTIIARIRSQIYQENGFSLFQKCTCDRFGLTLPSSTPSTPITSCGRSAVASGASVYLNRPLGRIVGGQEVKDCQYPWQVYISLPNGNCGGTLVDNKHVITAAHCVYFASVNEMLVSVGSSTRESLRHYKASKIEQHPFYDPPTRRNDIAVITLQQELEFNVCVQPACLPSASLNISTGVRCLATGWGVTSDKPLSVPPAILQEAIIPILSQASCSSYGILMDGSKLCAGYLQGGIDTCEGDSGGPLMCADGELWVLAGVISYGYGCAQPGFPGIYINVLNSLGWLQTVLN